MLNDRDVRKILIKIYKLTPAEERLFFIIREIYFFWGETRECYASNETLINETNMSSGTVGRALKVLESKKLIKLAYEKTKGFLSRRNIYPLEDELLKADARSVIDEREQLMSNKNEVYADHYADQYDQRTLIKMKNHDDQNDHINNQSLNNHSLNNNKGSTNDQSNSVIASNDPHLDHQAIKDKWNAIAQRYRLQSINVVSPPRVSAYKARIKDIGGEDAFWSSIETAIKNSAFLRGQNNRKWKVTFDWITTQSRFIRVVEGNYSDGGSLLDEPAKPIEKASEDFVKDFFTFSEDFINELRGN